MIFASLEEDRSGVAFIPRELSRSVASEVRRSRAIEQPGETLSRPPRLHSNVTAAESRNRVRDPGRVDLSMDSASQGILKRSHR